MGKGKIVSVRLYILICPTRQLASQAQEVTRLGIARSSPSWGISFNAMRDDAWLGVHEAGTLTEPGALRVV
eukprot:353408-Chlamydomonas_euryale.AAC.7